MTARLGTLPQAALKEQGVQAAPVLEPHAGEAARLNKAVPPMQLDRRGVSGVGDDRDDFPNPRG
jgi:hypothetical protein